MEALSGVEAWMGPASIDGARMCLEGKDRDFYAPPATRGQRLAGSGDGTSHRLFQSQLAHCRQLTLALDQPPAPRRIVPNARLPEILQSTENT